MPHRSLTEQFKVVHIARLLLAQIQTIATPLATVFHKNNCSQITMISSVVPIGGQLEPCSRPRGNVQLEDAYAARSQRRQASIFLSTVCSTPRDRGRGQRIYIYTVRVASPPGFRGWFQRTRAYKAGTLSDYVHTHFTNSRKQILTRAGIIQRRTCAKLLVQRQE